MDKSTKGNERAKTIFTGDEQGSTTTDGLPQIGGTKHEAVGNTALIFRENLYCQGINGYILGGGKNIMNNNKGG